MRRESGRPPVDNLKIIVLFFTLFPMAFCPPLLFSASTKHHTTVKIDRHAKGALTTSQQIYLWVLPERGDGYYHLSKRYTGKKANARTIMKANGDRKRLYRGRRVYVPFDLLTPAWKKKLLTALFPSDRRTGEGWEHTVVNESLWRIAEWYTGNGTDYKLIREFNNLATLNTRPGQKIVIPNRLLISSLRIMIPPKDADDLEYREEYAVYKLKKGEALYTSVVVRFTGNVNAQDVNEIALEYAKQSGIQDVTKIPVGYPIRVPYEDLLPRYLPEGHPRRLEWEKKIQETADLALKVQALALSGIHVVLDAGHGGKDTGAVQSGLWESTYVYDIMCRVKKILEETTEAKVYPTILDKRRKFSILENDRLPQHKHQVLMTTPPYELESQKVGVNLRWCIANDIFNRLVNEGVEKNKILFLSLHADALHPSLRGATVYIPGANYYKGTWNRRGGVYARFRESSRAFGISTTRKERLEYEALSRSFSRYLVETFTSEKISVHKYGPIRESVRRRRRQWVPAVLRYNHVPTRVMLEVCNLSNSEDQRLIQTSQFRQHVAEAIVKAIMDYYGEKPDVDRLLASG